MRIISKFHDYYDIGMGLGFDPSVVYVRDKIEVTPPQNTCKSDGFTRYILGFCGNLYLVLRGMAWSNIGCPWQTAWCHSIDDCDRLMKRVGGWQRDRYVGDGRKRHVSSYGPATCIQTRRGVLRWFEEFPTLQVAGKAELFYKYKTPIIVWEPSGRVVINAPLKPYEFMRVKDPYTAYQEVAQYVGGVLPAAGRGVPEIPDEVMQEIKGFDHEYSFRKEPGSKKR